MGPIAKLLLEQAGYELAAERNSRVVVLSAPPERNSHVIVPSSPLDQDDDDERMTNSLPIIHTSTERMMRLEEAVMRLTARVKALEVALEAMQGGK